MFQLENIVVKDVFEIEELTLKENVITIIGQSGTGKSTLLRLLNNLDDPTTGEILFKDKLLTDYEPQTLRQKIVMVPQNFVIYDGTIRENLLIGLNYLKEEVVDDQQLNTYLQQFSVNKSLDDNANKLSGGEKQRVALARVLLMEQAEVYLLDEPSSDLDDKTTYHVIGRFLQIARDHYQQVIMVTHHPHLSEKYAQTTINMDQYSKKLKEAES